jgi:hypothetical protein
MSKIDWKTFLNVIVTMFGIGFMSVSLTLIPYTIPFSPILLIGGISLILLGLYNLNGEAK